MWVSDHPHRRYNPLKGEWVLVSPQRLARPWQGQREARTPESLPAYEPDCYLCPGNTRAGGAVNPEYSSTYVFTNDFPALTDDASAETDIDEPLLWQRPVRGTSRVICFSPEHSRTLPLLPDRGIENVIDCWAEQVTELASGHVWIQVFENKGSEMGCSNPHPHGQIWAQGELPTEAAKEDRHLLDYARHSGSNLLIDYARLELERGERVVDASDDWLAVVPYWAVWPFETLLIPLTPVGHLHDLDTRQKRSLAGLLQRLLSRYDNLFECSFPYSMGWHGRPFNGEPASHWQLHAHIYPPLLRSADIRKFMVGYEMLAEPQRDLLPEFAAATLRELSPVHFQAH